MSGISAGVPATKVAKAWVNFNGIGVVAIRDSFNVSSITDNGVGQYRVNVDKNMNNAEYVVVAGGNLSNAHRGYHLSNPYGANNTSSFGLVSFSTATGAFIDIEYVNAIVFGE